MSNFSPYVDRPLACGEVSNINCLESWRDLLFIGTLRKHVATETGEFDLINLDVKLFLKIFFVQDGKMGPSLSSRNWQI
jgi:hypothetical protein